MHAEVFDIVVIGGGINGVGIAADAAGRGLRVLLCEKDDLANHTSSASSKLIHGGLRYLEQYEFRLVKEALREREVLLNIAPHLVHPLEFVLPYDSHLRPRFMIRMGLFLYDYLGHRKKLRRSRSVDFATDVRGASLRKQFTTGFSYMDCWTDDSRLVVMNAMRASEKGAQILTRTEVVSARRGPKTWEIKIFDKKAKKTSEIQAKCLVNATGAWVSDILQNVTHTSHQSQIKMVKGSHFIVPKLYQGDFAYILQNPDQRIIFVIPYGKNFSLIGTTDVIYTANPNNIEISEEEVNYLLTSVGYYFSNQPKRADIAWSYSGVRALYNDSAKNPSKITREYHLELNEEQGRCPILSVFGGKLTTYRTLAEHVMYDLRKFFPSMGRMWTNQGIIPGGDFKENTFQVFNKNLQKTYPKLAAEMLDRFARSYGSLAYTILSDAQEVSDLGEHFGADLYAREVDYLVQQEWAQTSEDILWRRSKLGISFIPAEVAALEAYLKNLAMYNTQHR